MPPEVRRIETDTAIPSSTGVVVIGGGIIGAATALFLSQRGIAVTLIEKGRIAGEQSSRNWGWVRKMGRDPRELPLMIESEAIWRSLKAVTGVDVGYRQSGIAYLCTNAREAEKRKEWLKMARPFGLDTQFIDADKVLNLFPGMAGNRISALYTPSDGRAEPQLAVPAIVAAARNLGARVVPNCAARLLELSAGRLYSVITEHGEIRCDAAVLAGGAWTSLFCGNMGLRLPQLAVQTSVARTSAMPGPECAALGPDYAFRRRLDGGYTVTKGLGVTAELVPDSFRFLIDFLPLFALEHRSVALRIGRRSIGEMMRRRRWSADEVSPFEMTRVLDPMPPEQAEQMIAPSLTADFPFFHAARVEQHWAGLIDAMPDTVPVISPAPGIPGFFIGTGFSGHGFGIGPGAGRLLADLVAGDNPVVDPTPFRFDRFTDGSRPRPMFGI